MRPATVAIIGSGPAGCYTAQFLKKLQPDTEITIVDRLPVPYGLIRYGVAPDHLGTKAVTAQFDRLFTRAGVAFIGNVDVDLHGGLDELSDRFDAVVVATGLTRDRDLDLPGWALRGRIGAGRFTRHLNAHPDWHEPVDSFGERIAIIGLGNVAVDVTRLVSLRSEQLHGTEISDEVLLPATERVRHITILSRSSAAESKCDPVMIKELLALPGVKAAVTGDLGGRAQKFVPGADGAEAASGGQDDLTPLQRARLELFAALPEAAAGAPDEAPDGEGIRIVFAFGATPREVLGSDRVEGLRFEIDGEDRRIEVETVVNAVGFEAHEAELQRAEHDHPNVFTVGWARRGPTGTIPENRADAKLVADAIAAHLDAHRGEREAAEGRASGGDFSHPAATSFEHWQKIDQHERGNAPEGRIRTKLRTRDALLRVAHTDD